MRTITLRSVCAWLRRGAVALALVGAQTLHAEITVGVSLTVTGPAASLGGPQKNTIDLLPQTIDGEPVRYFVLDDGNFPQVADKDARRLVESGADIIIGGSTVPSAMAIAAVAAPAKTPHIALAPIAPKPEWFPWVFVAPQSIGLMASAIFEHLERAGVKKLGYIGFNDGYGEAWLAHTRRLAEAHGIDLTIVERYDRTDRTALPQARRLLAANPDAILVAGSGTPSAMPMRMLRERGYKGRFYHTHGAGSVEFLRAVQGFGDGLVLPIGPVLVADQLPASHPSRDAALRYMRLYEGKHGAGSINPFGAHAWDAFLLFERAAKVALKQARPGTPQFRQALRDALEGTRNFPVSHGVVNMSDKNHNGLDERSRVLVTVEKGRWVLLPAP